MESICERRVAYNGSGVKPNSILQLLVQSNVEY